MLRQKLPLKNEGDLLAAHNFARIVLQTYLLIHLALIKDALSCMSEPSTLSFNARSMSLDRGSQAERRQSKGVFKKPRHSASSMQIERISKLIEKLKRLWQEAREKEGKIAQTDGDILV